MPRIAPLTGLPQDIEEALTSMMPKGVPPLGLFRTLAKNRRILEKLRQSNMLDRGTLSLRERELIIDRITALSGARYELGVHIAFFAEKIDLSPEQIRSIVSGTSSDDCWSEAEKSILKMCEELHTTSSVSDETYTSLSKFWDESQVIEAVAVAGYYKMISFLVNVIEPDPEPFAADLLPSG